MARKKILIAYATAGAGHKKAAMAVKKAFDKIGGDCDVDIVDVLDYTTAFFRWTYPRIYIFMVNRIPSIWGSFYYILDNRIFYSLVSWIRHLTNWINTRPLAKYLGEKNYDVIVSTHFLLPDVISMEGKDKIRSYLINIMTDYRLHSFWISKGIDMYVVAHDMTKNDLVSKYGVREDKIKVLGIPIDPVFSESKNKEELITRLGIQKGLFTVLIGSGGFGVGPIAELVKSFKGISIPIQLLVVCGKNDALCLSVGNLQKDIGIPIKVYGFVDNMDELMEVSDLMITKMGGMLSSEALAKSIPMMSLAAIPGQETRNLDVLLQSKVVLTIKDVKDAPRLVTTLYKDSELREGLIKRIASIRRPDSAYNAARMALEILK